MELASQTSKRLQAKGTRDLQYASSKGSSKEELGISLPMFLHCVLHQRD